MGTDKLKNIWTQVKTKDYTTIKPTSKQSLFTRFSKSIDRSTVPNEVAEKKNSNEVRTYGLSSNKVVQAVQKKFTKKGKLAVQDMKLKSINK